MLKTYTISVLVEEVHGEVRYTAGVKDMPGYFTEASDLQSLFENLYEAMSSYINAGELDEVESQKEQKRNIFEANDSGLEDR